MNLNDMIVTPLDEDGNPLDLADIIPIETTEDLVQWFCDDGIQIQASDLSKATTTCTVFEGRNGNKISLRSRIEHHDDPEIEALFVRWRAAEMKMAFRPLFKAMTSLSKFKASHLRNLVQLELPKEFERVYGRLFALSITILRVDANAADLPDGYVLNGNVQAQRKRIQAPSMALH